ncbi:MAG: DMT family transporter [Chloroflexi bacterium]|nr:DMT family transporter [Chloroflexota bacterium]
MTTPFFAAALALIAAFCWGAGDFTGGLATRRSDPFLTVFMSYSVGLAAMVIVALARGEKVTTPAALGWGALSGLSGMVGVGFLFRGFNTGRMGIVSPTSAMLATALPVVFEALTKGLPRELQLAGFGVALVGIWLISRPERLGGYPKGLGMALLAGIGFGGFFIGLGQVGGNVVFWPLAAGRAASVVVMAVFVLVTRRRVTLRQSPLKLFALAGLLDVGGNLFFLLAIQNGRLDVTAVLGSLYPAVTAVIAWWAIEERLTRFQVLGVAAAILAIVMITL